MLLADTARVSGLNAVFKDAVIIFCMWVSEWVSVEWYWQGKQNYWGADKSLARPTFRCILFDGENISFDASLVTYIYIYSTNIPPIMIRYDIFINCNWVVTLWQQYSAHLHTNSTQNDTVEQEYTERNIHNNKNT